jgi:acyl dehydratase
MLNYDFVKNWDFGTQVLAYTQRDTMLYALGIGMGADPLDTRELRFVYEQDLQALPTMAAALGNPVPWWQDARSGIDWVRGLHGEQSLTLARPLPTAGTLLGTTRVVSISDKGAGKGAIIAQQRELHDQASGHLIATGRIVAVLRGDGGYSAAGGRNDPVPEPMPSVPERAPDFEVLLTTLERQALLYRLSGDYNPLHVDPALAQAAGFGRPILHGLCTYGMAAHALLRSECDYDAARIRSIAVRFTAPVIPGETVRFQFWRAGAGRLQLRARVDSRDVVVMNNGSIELSVPHSC